MFDPATALFIGIPYAIYKLHKHRNKKVAMYERGARPDKVTGVRGQLIPEFPKQPAPQRARQKPSRPANQKPKPKFNPVARSVHDFQNLIDQQIPHLDTIALITEINKLAERLKRDTLLKQEIEQALTRNQNQQKNSTNQKAGLFYQNADVQPRILKDGTVQPMDMWHGTSRKAAQSIFHERIFKKGPSDAFYMTPNFEEAKGFAKDRDPNKNGIIIRLYVDPSVKLERSFGYWKNEPKGVKFGQFFSEPGIVPVEMYDMNKKRIV
ncbi:hypothetical protein TRIP_B350166 [uncultured Desulfatiglans sp.]|uniref:Uncharacterized protein n=1 Tax=Uncultured Desulfatiglans sp. TaxID=1748965 RepID=A0A653AAN7_UNCDX|nr:hypothetical protein TRIP_B350166 [uncultured Desulfatiglans sp.]